jgi:hypothetical protein
MIRLWICCLLLLQLLATDQCYGQITDPEFIHDPIKKRLNGEVHTIKQKIIFCDSQRVSYIHLEGNSTSLFGKKNAYLKSVVDTDSDQKTETYFYDAVDSIKKIVITNTKGIKEEIISFKYNKKHALIREAHDYHSSENYFTLFRYKNEKIISQHIVYPESKDSFRVTYKYDKKGNKTEEIREGITLPHTTGEYTKIVYHYYASNFLSNEMDYGRDGKLIVTRNFTYDDKKLLAKAETVYVDTKLYGNVKNYRYENSNLVEIITDYSGSDVNENITFHYEFDSQHNIIYKSIYKDGKLILELKRDILYY